MGLPTARERTYIPGSQVYSADLNEIQDVLINHEARLGPRHRMIAGAAGLDDTGAWTSVYAHKKATGGGPPFLSLPLVVESGERITATITVEYVTGVPASTGNNATLFREDAAGGHTTIASVAIANTAGPQTLTLVTAHDVVAQNAYSVVVDMGLRTSTGDKIVYQVDLLVTRP